MEEAYLSFEDTQVTLIGLVEWRWRTVFPEHLVAKMIFHPKKQKKI